MCEKQEIIIDLKYDEKASKEMFSSQSALYFFDKTLTLLLKKLRKKAGY